MIRKNLILTLAVLTSIAIFGMNSCGKDKKVKLIIKRICLIVCTIICCVLYKMFTDCDVRVLINSTIAAPVFYSWVMKPLLVKYNFGYKKDA